jgi:hypothetical protein
LALAPALLHRSRQSLRLVARPLTVAAPTP